MDSLPIISLEKLKQIDLSGGNGKNPENQHLYNVCLEHGFFYLKDHGISTELIRETMAASRNFFELPEEVKKQYGQDKQTVYPNTSRGYVPLYGETLHQTTGPDMKEIFDLGVERPTSDLPFTGQTLMPDDTVAPNFASSHYQLQREVLTKIVPHLLRGLAIALDCPPDWFDPYFDKLVAIHRTIYYPPEGGIAGKHTDNGIFTVLFQEYFPTPSLRVYTKDNWIDAMCLEDAAIVNLGDMLQLWTNHLFVSTPHEVLHNLNQSRISIPFFIYPNVNAVFQPIGTSQTINPTDIMLKNYNSIWVKKTGGGRALELK
ncbi:isopenicillin N synthase family dioxygenase [Roseofilum casamattae]|uniref:2-oxoglutarate and iron-dependent oxygenase domain-containing protein n=1 Tax=Roseofilum casamattae BLCC-M143 TaxID=3022442 RepID=A0ABT7BW15_9CYAN|nr:2-oxoglutarate and iron-dependent oxygenase domain-containing protein [Roseofilum casamattae]MDJ1183392.1 2-oxoglutarate and iron-dependent oxygenase domain-containing protein [Roseofilum casamattae BLCC-M143]